MLSKAPVSLRISDVDRSYQFSFKGSDSKGTLELVRDAKRINTDAAKAILVESFITEYKQYLSPNEISDTLTSWRDGEKSVEKYYEDYFKTELKDFSHGHVHYWVQASTNGRLIGWATFQREKSDPNAIYMNLLVVHPEYQKRGVGSQLVQALVKLGEISDLNAIHLLLRKKNRGGRYFYSTLGFVSNPEYMRDDNFVDTNLLEGLTWRNPSLQKKNEAYSGVSQSNHLFKEPAKIDDNKQEKQSQHDTYCGFKPGFLLGKRF
jgi:GNAT superfamily N-acetyltransferase